MPLPRSILRLTPEELDDLLGKTRECHVATVSPDGKPHVVPLWFAWHDGAVWLNSLIKSRRTRDIRAGSPASVCVDDGESYGELRGAVLEGRFEEVTDESTLERVREVFGAKYWGGTIPAVRSHVWVRLAADRVASWDFRKIPQGKDARLEAMRAREANRDEPPGAG